MFKWIGRIFQLGILLLILILVFHRVTFKWISAIGLGLALGAPVTIEDMRVDIRNTQAMWKGIKIGNPAGDFAGKTLADIPKIFLDFEISSLWEGRFHFETVEADIQELYITRMPDGRVNLISLKPLQKRESQEGAGRPTAGGPLSFQIDQLILTLGKVISTDMTGPQPVVKSASLHIDHAVYRNVNGLEDIVKIISWETLKRAGMGQLKGVLDRVGGPWGAGAGGLLEKIFG